MRLALRTVTIALAGVVILGVLSLWVPFLDDQVLFALGARTILSGEVLYQDFWDIKQPGIFFFFSLAGALLGLNELGVHLLEVAWTLVAAVALVWIAIRCVRVPTAAALAPLASLGVYLAHGEGHHRTQVEALVALPLALALAAAAGLVECPRSRSRGFLLGAATAGVGALKLLYLVLPTGFALLGAIALWSKHGRSSISLLLRIAGWALAGLAVVWLPMLAYFAVHGALPELAWTSFGYPTETLRDVAAAPLPRLSRSTLWMARIYFPWAPLVVIGLAGIAHARHSLLSWGIATYLFLGAGLIVIQKTSWWEYHFVLLFPPLGLLAAIGLDHALEFARERGVGRTGLAWITVALLVLPATSLIRQASGHATRLAAASALSTDAPLAVRLDVHSLRVWESTRFIREGGRPGSLYTLGDPRILWLSGRRQSIPVHGHSWKLFPQRMWERLPSDLMAAEPQYVFVDPNNWRMIKARSPELAEYLNDLYEPIPRFLWGRLFVRRD